MMARNRSDVVRHIAIAILIVISFLIWIAGARAETGLASVTWTSGITASGERFNPAAMTAAHRTLPFGATVRVTLGSRSVEVRVNDRGPFVRGRIIDLSPAAARAVGMSRGSGLAKVSLDVVSPATKPPPPRAAAVVPQEVAAAPVVPVFGLALYNARVLASLSPYRTPMFRVGRRVAAALKRAPRPSDAAPAPFAPGDLQRVSELDEARRSLVLTAIVGGTMGRQGADVAIGRLHPTFAVRLARAVREARAAGIQASVFSAYRPPAFGVGGFSDKFNSMHAYGLAVDMAGIGGPGSSTAIAWFKIAGRHRLYNPYGPRHRAEWNHFQPTFALAVARGHPLRSTITRDGPRSEEVMWRIGGAIISEKVVTEVPRYRAQKKRHRKKRWRRWRRRS